MRNPLAINLSGLECWINVYKFPLGKIYNSTPYYSKYDAINYTSSLGKLLYRIHVRLK